MTNEFKSDQAQDSASIVLSLEDMTNESFTLMETVGNRGLYLDMALDGGSRPDRGELNEND